MGGNSSISNGSYFSRCDADDDLSLFTNSNEVEKNEKKSEENEKNYEVVKKKKSGLFGFSSQSLGGDIDDDIMEFQNIGMKDRKEGGDTIDCAVCMDDEGKFIKLKCDHFFHRECLLPWLNRIPKEGEEFITNHARCPLCRRWIFCKNDKKINAMVVGVREKWKRMVNILIDADIDLKHKKVLKDRKNDKDALFDFMKDYQFFLCYDCGEIYFGGLKACGVDDGEEINEERLKEEKKDHVCVKCKARKMSKNWPTNCKKHGNAFIVFKCRYCCNIANWFCFGTTHFCERCHKQYPNMKVHKCKGLPECDGSHLPNGTEAKSEQCLGCCLCRKSKED